MKKKRAIVTGGLGFIGSHLAELLIEKNFKVIVIDNLSTGKLSNISKDLRKKIAVHKFDLCNKNKLNQVIKKNDLVFHLASRADIVPSIEKPLLYFDSNVLSTQILLEICRQKKIKKFIYAASSSSYGIPKSFPTNENASMDPQYPYALSKWLGEELCIHWNKVYKVPVIVLRLFNVYGPRARTNGSYGAMFGVFLGQKKSNKPLTVVGTGNQKRDFTFVTDVAQGFYKASISKKKFGIFNLSSQKPIKVIDIAKKLSNKILFIPKRPGEPDITHGDSKKFRKNFNWSPMIEIDEGIKIMLSNSKWIKDAPVWTKNKIFKATKLWFKYLK